jgi:hypothetical protein
LVSDRIGGPGLITHRPGSLQFRLRFSMPEALLTIIRKKMTVGFLDLPDSLVFQTPAAGSSPEISSNSTNWRGDPKPDRTCVREHGKTHVFAPLRITHPGFSVSQARISSIWAPITLPDGNYVPYSRKTVPLFSGTARFIPGQGIRG